MNEKVKGFFKISRFWLIIGGILLIWGVCGTVTAILYQRELAAFVKSVENSDGGELISLIEQHDDTTIEVHDDIVATRIELQSALGRVAELEQRIERATEYAELADAELADFGNTVASSGNTLQATISLQQRIIEFVKRIKEYNSAITAELGDSP